MSRSHTLNFALSPGLMIRGVIFPCDAGQWQQPQHPLSHAVMRVNSLQPFKFSLSGQHSINYGRCSILYYKTGCVLDDFAICRLMSVLWACSTCTSLSCGFPSGREPTCQFRRRGFDPWNGKSKMEEKEMATHSSILAWEISWTEEPGEPHSMESQKRWMWQSN